MVNCWKGPDRKEAAARPGRRRCRRLGGMLASRPQVAAVARPDLGACSMDDLGRERAGADVSVATVAIAEDEADLREAIAEYLTGHGYRVLSARDAASFRELAGREPIDVAVLDISMPGEDG